MSAESSGIQREICLQEGGMTNERQKKKDVYMQHEEIKVQFNSMLQYRPGNIFVHKSTTAK